MPETFFGRTGPANVQDKGSRRTAGITLHEFVRACAPVRAIVFVLSSSQRRRAAGRSSKWISSTYSIILNPHSGVASSVGVDERRTKAGLKTLRFCHDYMLSELRIGDGQLFEN
jgi:hypothetical protein